jgi:Carboxypeptidase regulatory-like domain
MASVIRGTVLDPEGAPIAGARVFYKSSPIAVPDVAILTDERGRFAMGAPAAGDYELRCVADGFAQEVVATSVGLPGEVELEVRLSPA